MNARCTHKAGGRRQGPLVTRTLPVAFHKRAAQFRRTMRSCKASVNMRLSTTLLLISLLMLETVVAAPPHKTPRSDSWCEFICDDNYEPVCAIGENGFMKSFHNRCVYEYNNCINGIYLAVMKEGEC
ncbi:uncharacterized protein [Periplaneta americana]|uniref:uncharacterized protein n=1 Tax=Periplaneta americana TaxID=6978 RepID=UPI0037E98E28